MGDQASFYGRLCGLLDKGRSTAMPHLSEGLLAKLETDFAGEKKVFSDRSIAILLFEKQFY